jgi:hypothetical protein
MIDQLCVPVFDSLELNFVKVAIFVDCFAI